MKKFIVSLLLVLITASTFAQSKTQDVVYLKNGSIIRGEIVEQIPNKSIKVETADKNIFVFQFDEIEKITKEAPQNKKANTVAASSFKPGYSGALDFGFMFGLGYGSENRIKLDVINSYQFNPYFSAGVGVGFRFFTDVDAVLVPIYANLKTSLPLLGSTTPYISLGVGYSFNASDDFNGVGLIITPTLGANIKLSEKYSMNVGIGYEIQKTKITYINKWDGNTYTYNESNEALSLTIGFPF